MEVNMLETPNVQRNEPPTLKVKLNQLLSCLEVFRQVDQEMPSQRIVLFLLVASRPGMRMSDVAKKLGLSSSAVSRNLSELSKWGIGINKPGVDLLYAEENPQDRREKMIYLTPKGERLVETLNKLS